MTNPSAGMFFNEFSGARFVSRHHSIIIDMALVKEIRFLPRDIDDCRESASLGGCMDLSNLAVNFVFAVSSHVAII